MKNIMKSIIAIILVLTSIPASMAMEIRGSVVDNKTGVISWNAQNFAGFYYDINKNISSETLSINLSGRNIAEGDLKYVSVKVPAEYKAYEKEKLKVNKETDYQVLGWRGEKWIAIGGKANKLAKLGLEMDTTEKKTLTVGNVWKLPSGYELSIKAVDAKATPRQAWLTLSKDGKTVDDTVVEYKTMYEYTDKILGDSDVLIFAVYVDSIFSGTTTDMIQLKYGWMIQPDTAKEIKTSDTYGVLEVVQAGTEKIELKNKNTVYLSINSEVDIMDNMKFKIADSEILRFYPKIDTDAVIGTTPVPTQVVTAVATTQTPAPVTTTTTPPPTAVVTTAPTIVVQTTLPAIPIEEKKGLPGFTGILALVCILGVCLLIKRR